MRRVILSSLLGLGMLFAFDGVLFHSGFYNQFLLPYSSAGMFHMVVKAEQNRPFDNPNQVLAVGDSRMALRTARASRMGSGFTYGFAGVAGTLPRCWYYLLREVDPGRNRYAAILLPVDDYSDEDWEVLSDRSTDLRFLITALGLGDIWEFAGSFNQWEHRTQAAMGILLKGIVLKDDVQALLAAPQQRLASNAAGQANWFDAQENYQGTLDDMRGLIVDWRTMRAIYPPRLNAEGRRVVDDFLLHQTTTHTGKLAAYRRKWFGQIIERYKGSRTKLIFYRIPRGAAIRPDNLLQKQSFTIPSFRGLPNVIVLEEHLLDEVEKPEYFMDALHLNAEGCRRLTAIMVAKVREVMTK